MAVSAERIDCGYTLDHQYVRERSRIMISGVLALVRLPPMRRGGQQNKGKQQVARAHGQTLARMAFR